MKTLSIFRNLAGLGAIVLALSMASPTFAAQSADSDQISKLLSLAKNHARMAQSDAAKLQAYTRSRHSWKSHAEKLTTMKDNVNEHGKIDKELNDLRAEGSPWQQAAIDQIDPRLRELAGLLTATIEHLSENQSRIHMPAYRDYVHANYELAHRTAEIIEDFVDYDQAKSKAESLEQKLELPEVAKN